MTDTPQVLLAHHLKTLKLPTFLREYDKLARQCATEGADHVRYLVRLTELELIDRERRMVERRIRQARFPAVKSLDSFDFKAIASLNKMLVLELARCEYVERRENIIALGNSGTGKTHIALGLGLAACQKGLSVGFLTAAALVHELMEARDEKRLLRLQKQLAKYHLLIIDELGFVPLSKTGAELLFEVFSQRYASDPVRVDIGTRTQTVERDPIFVSDNCSEAGTQQRAIFRDKMFMKVSGTVVSDDIGAGPRLEEGRSNRSGQYALGVRHDFQRKSPTSPQERIVNEQNEPLAG